MPKKTKIAMWSGPRNVSTALMYSFNERFDCYVTDEPLYANYLEKTGIKHPDFSKIIKKNETDFSLVIKWLTGPIPEKKSIWYQKHMCHHIPPESDISWIDCFSNCFLIRNPREVILSLSKITDFVSLDATGLPQQLMILNYMIEKGEEIPPIIDSKDLLENPDLILMALCRELGIDYLPQMTSWDVGPKKCDGIWAKHWYNSAWSSSGFNEYIESDGELVGELESVNLEAQEIYQKLWERRLLA